MINDFDTVKKQIWDGLSFFAEFHALIGSISLLLKTWP